MSQSPTSRVRDQNVDALRGLGLVLIMLAHVNPPEMLFQLRNLDVVLIVLVSGSAFMLSRGRASGTGEYLWRRMSRILVPTWSFLGLYFMGAALVAYLLGREFPYGIRTIAESFLLLNGIGYVWIMRVLLLMAFLAPLVRYAMSRLSSWQVWLLAIGVLVAYEIACWTLALPDGLVLRVLVREFGCYAVAYGVVYVLGASLSGLTPRVKCLAGLAFLVLFGLTASLLWQMEGGFVATQVYKYPPRAYYLEYGLGVSLILWALTERFDLGRSYLGERLAWLGARTMWLYLWHIAVIGILHGLGVELGYGFQLCTLLGGSVALVFVQERIVDALERRLPARGSSFVRLAFGVR